MHSHKAPFWKMGSYEDLDELHKKRLRAPDVLYPNPRAPLEWWYFNGHLTSGSRKFTYSTTIFKIHPAMMRFGPLRASVFDVPHQFVVHTSLGDAQHRRFTAREKVETPRIHKKLHLELNDTRIRFRESNPLFELTSDQDQFGLSLKAKPVKGLVKHFDHGYFEFGRESRTYYVSYPRLSTTGEITLDGKRYTVTGESWFDHQKLHLERHPTTWGWDWFSLLLDDQSELMIYAMREDKVRIGATYIEPCGRTQTIHDTQLRPLHTWKSKNTGVKYPVAWELRIPSKDILLHITPTMPDQEMQPTLSAPFAYYEGGGSVQGVRAGKTVTGKAYMELVGHDQRPLTRFLKWMMT